MAVWSMGLKVLLVDDDPCALQAVASTLRRYLPALTIESCESAVSALSRLRHEPFAVVVSDFKMPDMNGLGLLRGTRECGSDASFILITGDSTDDMLTQGLRFGMFALVEKPLNRSTFIPLVQQAIECHRLRQEVAELRRALIESDVVCGSAIQGLIPETDEAFQPSLPY
jgi:two-component system, NtrC family, C4-dicarboxylate transport response regulator DctD